MAFYRGVYWYQSGGMHQQVMVTVRLECGKLIVWWLNEDVPVTSLKGHWLGPVREFGL